MEFLDMLGKKASEAYKITADKTGKIAKETKMKLRIGELKNQVNGLYQKIGKEVYEKHVLKEKYENEETNRNDSGCCDGIIVIDRLRQQYYRYDGK